MAQDVCDIKEIEFRIYKFAYMQIAKWQKGPWIKITVEFDPDVAAC